MLYLKVIEWGCTWYEQKWEIEESIIRTASEICIIHHIIQKPNLQRIIVILFIPNILKFLAPFFRRKLISNIGQFHM